MFAHGNSRMELLVTGTLHPPPPPRAGMEERKSNLIPRPSSPSLSRKIKSSFNPRDPKQGGGGKGGGKQEQRTSSITGGEKKKSRRSSSGEHAVSAIDYAEMKFHPVTIPLPPRRVIFNSSSSSSSFSSSARAQHFQIVASRKFRASSPNKSHGGGEKRERDGDLNPGHA